MLRKSLIFALSLIVIAGVLLVSCDGTNTQNTTDTNTGGETTVAPPTEEPSDETGGEATEVVETPEETPEIVTTRVGGWLDEIAMSVVGADSAVTQISAGAIDIYAGNLATPQDLAAINEAGLERSDQFGLFYEIRFNVVGPTFEGTGKLNPFFSAKIREAMNWLIDRDYINQEIYGGASIPKFLPITAGFPTYARYIEHIRPLEAKYAYNFEKAQQVISAEMEAMGAEMVDGKWQFNGEDVVLIFLIRTDSDGTRVPMGDYVANQLESIGFTVDRQYKTSSEASPIWVLGNPNDGLWHLYTGAWGVSGIDRSEGDNIQFHYTPQSSYAFSPLWQAYDPPAEFIEISEALANATFSTLEEREELFARGLEMTFELSYTVWVIDGKGFSPWDPKVSVSYDLAAGVDINQLYPFTLRLDGQEGGLVRWANADMFIDPANPVAGSNWTFDSQWQNPTADYGVLFNPFTGVFLPQRIERAEVTVQEGLPVSKTYDWVTLEFVPEIQVPGDAFVDWDIENQVFITADEKFPDGLTAKRKSVVYYPAELWDITWHDGSPMSIADFIMYMIMIWEPGMEGSALYDSSQTPVLESFMSTFKGWRIVSTDPMVLEYYSDTWFMDAEYNVFDFWPNLGYGDAAWHILAVTNKVEASQEAAYSANKSDELEVEWMNLIGGPTLEIIAKYLDEAIAENFIPFAPTLGQYITAEEAAARYQNLLSFFQEYGHFWVGVGPYILDDVYLVEKTLTLKHNPNYIDLADKWLIFSEPMLAEVSIDGSGRVVIGEEAIFDVFVTYKGEPYADADIDNVKYLLFDGEGNLVEVGQAELVEEGHYQVILSAESTGKLPAGANKLEVAVAPIPVSIPSFASFEFVSE